jgi:CheY-like chemotaxis protein
MAEQNTYDVILMDVQMPGMDGLAATAAIRQQEANRRRVPILALTAHAMAGDRARCLAAGMDGYLAKPINAQTLVGMVEGAAERSMSGWADTVEPASACVPSSPVAMGVFDPQEALVRCLNSKKMLRDMIQSYLHEIDGLLSEMRAALSANDLVKVGHLGHCVKGTAVYLGAHDATEAAAGVEQFCVTRDGTVADAKKAVKRLHSACRRLADALVKNPCWLEGRSDCETAGAHGTPDN